MAYCRNCGKEIDDRAVICPGCGVPQGNMNLNSYNQPAEVDHGGFGWGVLGFFVPIAGLILFLIWRDTKPKTAKAAGIGALVSVIVGVVLAIVYIALFAALFSHAVSSGAMYYN